MRPSARHLLLAAGRLRRRSSARSCSPSTTRPGPLARQRGARRLPVDARHAAAPDARRRARARSPTRARSPSSRRAIVGVALVAPQPAARRRRGWRCCSARRSRRSCSSRCSPRRASTATLVGFDHIVDPVIAAPAFPSGHATAAMSLALAALIVAPRALAPARRGGRRAVRARRRLRDRRARLALPERHRRRLPGGDDLVPGHARRRCARPTRAGPSPAPSARAARSRAPAATRPAAAGSPAAAVARRRPRPRSTGSSASPAPTPRRRVAAIGISLCAAAARRRPSRWPTSARAETPASAPERVYALPRQAVGGQGSPVRNRRGPATVTG